jgi:hypothetical protein
VFNTADPETFWLTTTNIVLGLVVFSCIVVMARAIFQELRARKAKRVARTTSDRRAPVIPLVGVTMADGGEKIADASRRKDRLADARTSNFLSGE